jgi:hypothetical protein
MATEMSTVNDQGFKSGFAAKIMREEKQAENIALTSVNVTKMPFLIM